jgi:predicted aspartyl protease
MWQHNRKLIIACGTYLGAAILLAGCQSEAPQQQSPTVAVPPTVAPVAPQPSPVATPPQDSAKIYDEALSKAAAAGAIRQSALSKDDWLLIAENMQTSVDLLKSLPPQSSQSRLAAKILPDYQQKLTIARQKASNFVPKPTPSIAVTASVDRQPTIVRDNSAAFSMPIVEKLNGIPVVEVNFNGNYTARMLLDTGASRTLITQAIAQNLQLKIIGKSQAKTANGIGTFAITALDSIKFGSGETRNVMVSIGANDLEYGLLGHDVYDGYDITIKESSIDFKRRS